MDWIYSIQDSAQCRDFVKNLLELQVELKVGKFII